MLYLLITLIFTAPFEGTPVNNGLNVHRSVHSHNDEICRIYTRDHDIKLVLTQKTVFMQLSEETLHRINREMDDDLDDEEGMGKDIARAIINGVKDLLDEKISFDIDDIESVSYHDDGLHFEYSGQHWLTFDEIHTGDSIALDEFDREDAEKFIDAFYREKNRR